MLLCIKRSFTIFVDKMSKPSSVIQLRTTKSFLFGMGCFFVGMAISKFSFAALGSTESTNCPQSAGPFFAATWFFVSFCCLFVHTYQYAFSTSRQQEDNFKLVSWQTTLMVFIILLTGTLCAFNIYFAVTITRSSEGETCIKDWNLRALHIAEGVGCIFFMFAFGYYSIVGGVNNYLFDPNSPSNPYGVISSQSPISGAAATQYPNITGNVLSNLYSQTPQTPQTQQTPSYYLPTQTTPNQAPLYSQSSVGRLW
jgi:hypothetical protein